MDQRRRSILLAYIAFLRANTRLWLACVVFVILLLGALIVFGRTDAAPFIYTLY